MGEQCGGGIGTKRSAGVDGFVQGFGTMGTTGASEPAVVQRFVDQVEGIQMRNSQLFFIVCTMLATRCAAYAQDSGMVDGRVGADDPGEAKARRRPLMTTR